MEAQVARKGASLFRAALCAVEEDVRKRHTPVSESQSKFAAARLNWKRLALKGSLTDDPWEDLLDETRVELAEEHHFDVTSSSWSTHEILVRVNLEKPVAKGRMRECFRVKKITTPIELDDAERVPLKRSVSEEEARIDLLLRRMKEGNIVFADDYSVAEMKEWQEMQEVSLLQVLRHIGRRTLCRIRTKLGLQAVSFQHPKILTVGEIVVLSKGAMTPRGVELVFKHECHSFTEDDFETLRALIARGFKDDSHWQRASLNVMCKRYMEEKHDRREVYENDVAMQQQCKELAIQFNSFNPKPPKEIDMLHVGLIKLVNREGQHFLGYESFIEGHYQKYNTNAGWIEGDDLRHTPQVFSFFTFRQTLGKVMVVDIQGVGNLFTDPQVHTHDGKCFGEGNLGARGMALFLRGFKYALNPIADYMGLAPFNLLDGEQEEPSLHEIERFIEGKKYLDSSIWKGRRKSSQSGENSLVPIDEMNKIADFLSEMRTHYRIGECPKEEVEQAQIPNELTPEGYVHLALAQLYREEDDRVASSNHSFADLERFHTWMAALAGSAESMARFASEVSQSPEDRLDWLVLAASRGHRQSCLDAFDFLPSDKADLRIAMLKAALEADDGKTDQDRKADLELVTHEIYAKLAETCREIEDLLSAHDFFEKAAEEALSLGDFRAHQRYSQALQPIPKTK